MKANASHLACLFFYLLYSATALTVKGQGHNAFTMGGKGLMHKDLFSGFNNPALAVQLKSHGLASSTSSYYAVRAIRQFDFNYVKPIHNSLLALSYGQRGNSTYRQNNLSLSLAQKANQFLSFGIRSDYRRFSINRYGKTEYFNLDVFTCLSVNAVFSTSMAFAGCIQMGKELEAYQKNQKSVCWGIQYQAEEKLCLLLEIEKSFNFRTGINCGMVYAPDSTFQINCGFSNAFSEIGLGLTYKKNKFVYGTAFKIHWQLGISSNISLAYEIKS